jgi:hypothetical protein
MMTASESKIQVVQRALDAAEKQYEENSKISMLLEDKAQKSATIAGVLLAAGLTFVKKETFGPLAARFSIPFVEAVVVLTVVLLLLTIALCVFVLWLRERPSLPAGRPQRDGHSDECHASERTRRICVRPVPQRLL